MENHKVTEAKQYASVGKNKKVENIVRVDWGREETISSTA